MKLTDFKLFLLSFCLVLSVFVGTYASYALGEDVTLSVTVASTLSFTSSTDQFGTLTPGVPKIATTTLSVTTNNVAGWNVTLSGTDQSPTDTVMDLDSDPTIGITDDTEWSIAAAAATTTAGNATSITSGDDILAFRVMSASSSNGAAFLSTAWWGTSDVNYNASQLWAGIASTTNVSRIGNAGTGSYSASTHINTVQYYLDVPSTQATGAYSGALVYTATAN